MKKHAISHIYDILRGKSEPNSPRSFVHLIRQNLTFLMHLLVR